MKNNRIIALLSKKADSIILFGLLIASLSFVTLELKEKNFKVSTDYLIVQNQSGSQDFYTLSKSAEYIGRVLNEGVYSELFINEVVKTGKVNSEFLPFDKKEKLKQWSKMVQVSRNPELGIISIEVYDNDQRQSVSISQAIAEVLTTKNDLFRGEGQNIDVKILSGPVVEKNPTIANIVAVAVGGFVLGLLISALWYVAKEDARKKEIFSRSSNFSRSLAMNSGTGFRMETAGNFMSEDEYQESLKFIE